MKCGHLFGFQCIHNWFGKSRTALCPSCSQLGKKSDLRNIYATSVKLMDDKAEQQIMEKYLREKQLKERFEEQVKHMQISLEYMQMEIKGLEQINRELLVSDRKGVEEEYEYVLLKKIAFKATYAILLIDNANQNILISYRDAKTVGFVKSEYSYDACNYISALHKSPDVYFINDFKLSPWNDGFVLLTYNKTIRMMNTNTGNEIITLEIVDKVKCVCFNETCRNLFHFCDVNGFLYTYDIEKLSVTQKVMVDSTVHTIVALKNIVIATSLTNWYKVYYKEETVIEKQLIPEEMQCMHIYLFGEILVFNLRMNNKRSNIVLYQVNKFESERNNHLVLGTPKYLQTKSVVAKRNCKVLGNTLYLVNSIKNIIEFYDIRSYKVYYCIKISEQIVEFCVSESRVVVLGISNVYIFNRENSNFAAVCN